MIREIVETNDEMETWELGRRLGLNASSGQLFTLVGDLGVGKTVFTKGLAAGLGIKEPVSSPTFTIVQVYDKGRLPLYHFDVYRIGDICEMADQIQEILPEHYTEIRIEKDLERGFDYRRISICEY